MPIVIIIKFARHIIKISLIIYYFYLILAIVTVKIVYLGFLASRASGVAPIMRIFRVLSLLRLSIVSYLGLGLVLGTKLVLNSSLGSLSIPFIIGY